MNTKHTKQFVLLILLAILMSFLPLSTIYAEENAPVLPGEFMDSDQDNLDYDEENPDQSPESQSQDAENINPESPADEASQNMNPNQQGTAIDGESTSEEGIVNNDDRPAYDGSAEDENDATEIEAEIEGDMSHEQPVHMQADHIVGLNSRSDAIYGVIINVSNLKDTDYENLGNSYHELGFKFSLYAPDDLSTVIQESQTGIFETGTSEYFSNLTPGDYKLKISHAPAKFQNYKLDNYYTLRIKSDGNHQLELYQKDGKYNLSNPNGSSDPVGLPGMKTPLFLPIAKDNPPEKFILENGQEQTESKVSKGDLIKFRIRKTISPDHNTVLNYPQRTGNKDYINFGTKVDQSFNDYLDERLEFIPDSLTLTLDGQATLDYKASYDATNHCIRVTDESKPNIIKFDYNTPIVIPKKDQELVVSFKVRVKQADGVITNTVGNSTVKLIPFKVEGHKIWQDQDNIDKTRPESITVQLLANGKEVDRKIVTANDNWSWSFIDLPRVDEAGNTIVYSVQEDPVEKYETSVDGYDITNTYNPHTPPPTEPTSPTEPTVPPPRLTVFFPQVVKRIEGARPAQADVFNFLLEAVSYRPLTSSLTLTPEQMPMPDGSLGGKKLVSITGEGVTDWGRVTYTQPGEYTYRIKEVAKMDLPYEFSPFVYTLIDRVYEEQGQLVYQRTLTREGLNNNFSATYFINTYTGNPPHSEQATSLPRTGEKAVSPVLCLTLFGIGLWIWGRKKNL